MIKVAIVEDTDDIREAMKVIINGSEGFNCSHVYNNGDLALLELPNIAVDVVLMDINMPGKSGIECVRILKEKMPATQFLMVTVYDDIDNIFNALKSGATGYLLKKTSAAQLLEAIKELHNGGSPMSTGIARCLVASLQNRKDNTDMLTDREREILRLLSKGFLYKEIAAKLEISLDTVKKHIQNIYGKLQVQNKTDALNKAFPK
ncbi:MAG: response regulator transcription factor [Bacteroidota bacterium]